ncbi:MAG: TA system VapC family ribonuclease toxin [Candidatus Hydrogenedentes bacterium]|nr:TA system VapC family ribonuclease toxin [Candidatus Hydrogenedentota bacterium]
MIGVDTNILVYAHREDSPYHDAAFDTVQELAEDGMNWTIPWPCIHEFLAIVTHPQIFSPPTPLAGAIEQVEAWMQSPSIVLASETSGYWKHLREMVSAGRVQGPRTHDARIAAICLLHGVKEFWSADRDFTRFPKLRTRNPLVHNKD